MLKLSTIQVSVQFSSVQFTSVAQSCPTICNPINCTTPGFPIHQQLLDFTQTHVHQVSDAIQPSHLLSSPFSSHLQSFPKLGSFPMNQFFTSGSQSVGVSASASVLPMNIHDWFPLGWTSLISLAVQRTVKGLLQHHSSKASILWCSAFFMVQLSSLYDYWKNHSFE